MSTPVDPRASARYLVINTGRRAAARITALGPIVAAHEAELSVPDPRSDAGRPDKQGNRTVTLFGDREVVTRLARQALPALLERMEADAATAARSYNAHLRGRVAREELALCDLPTARRAFRRAFLAAWGAAYRDRANALVRGTDPQARASWHTELPPTDPDGEPDPTTEARRSVAAGFDPAHFATEIAEPVQAARERMDVYRAACRAAGLDPNTGAAPQPDPYEERAQHLATFGEITGDGEWARLPLTLANGGEKAEARAEAATEVIRALGGEVFWRREADRWGRHSTDISGSRPVLELLRARLGSILAQAERAARKAVRELYGPSIERQPLTDWQRASRRSAWGQEFIIGYCEAYAARISAARNGRADATRAGASVRVGATRDQDGNAYDLDEAGRRLGKAEADRLPSGEFAGYPAELGYRRPPQRAVSVLVTCATSGEQLTDGVSWVRVADAEAPGAERIRALDPVLTACRVTLARVARDYDGMRERRADRATLEGHPQLTALAAGTVIELVAQMDRSAARAARRARVPEPQRRRWIEAYRIGWGEAYGARLHAALAGASDARAQLPAPVAGPAYYRAALDVDEIPTGHLHRLAARVAAVTDPADLPIRTVWHLEIEPSPCYPASHRSRAALAVARAHGLAADYPDVPDRSGPLGRCEVIRFAGPTALADAVTAVLPELFERADAVVAAHLPALERQLDQRRSTPAARAASRAAWSGSVVDQFLHAYAERIEAARAGDPAARRPGARTGELDARAALAAADAIEPAEFAAIAAACAAADSALATAWRARLPRPEAHRPRPRLVIVPGGRAKAAHATPAAALYTGGCARAALKAADALRASDSTVQVAILSARHGLITDLDQRIEPYETTLGDPDAISPAQLRRQAAAAGLADAQVTILAGHRYATLATAVWPDAATPLDGAGDIGRHLQRLSHIAADPDRALAPTT